MHNINKTYEWTWEEGFNFHVFSMTRKEKVVGGTWESVGLRELREVEEPFQAI